MRMTTSDPSNADLPIGVFDSGVGGLTVLRALRAQLPNESTIYLGDSARVPYGTKSTDFLVGQGVKLLVIACNTASALAIDQLAARHNPLPVVGVVEPGAAAAVAATRGHRHLVLATESTVRHHAYARAIRALDPSADVQEVGCSLLVALAEEGWTEGAIAESIARKYVEPALGATGRTAPDSVVLGCTHFPLLEGPIRAAVGAGPVIVDSATTTAEHVGRLLEASGARRQSTSPPAHRLIATDGPARFAALGSRFLAEHVDEADVEIVDL
jgi:glutamate racemase